MRSNQFNDTSRCVIVTPFITALCFAKNMILAGLISLLNCAKIMLVFLALLLKLPYRF